MLCVDAGDGGSRLIGNRVSAYAHVAAQGDDGRVSRPMAALLDALDASCLRRRPREAAAHLY